MENRIENSSTGYRFQVDYNQYNEDSILLNSSISDCEIGFLGYGKIVIDNLQIKNATQYGIHVTGNLKKIVNCNISGLDCPGISMDNCQDVEVKNNILNGNSIGIKLKDTENNLIFNNFFIENDNQVVTNGNDKWNKYLPSGGNYWSDYIGSDKYKGTYQTDPGSDGFGDAPYSINGDETDRYPIFIDKVNPTAIAGTDIVVNSGDIVHFDASESFDDQLIEKAKWEWNYSGQIINIELMEFDFKFLKPGIFNITLTVFDFAENKDEDHINVTVIDIIPPFPLSQGNITLNQGEIAYFNGSGSTDNGIINNYTWSYSYNDSFIELFGSYTQFKFDIPGLYEMLLRVTDEAGNANYLTFTVDVRDTENPLANAGLDIAINNGDLILFNGGKSKDNGIIIEYIWSFEYDGIVIYLDGLNPSFTFYKPGFYNVTLVVIDEYSNSDNDTLVVTVKDTIDPVAKISGSLTVLEGEILSLNGLDSTDNDVIASYIWTFYDTEDKMVSGSYLNYSFQTYGELEITLTVHDRWMNWDEETVIVNIADTTSPIAIAGNDTTIQVGTEITLDGSRSSDNGNIVRWVWTFEYDNQEIDLEGESVDFTFEIVGEYNILLTVFDQSDYYGEDIIIITVTDPVVDDDDDVRDDDINGKENELSILLVIIIGIVVLLIIGVFVIILVMKKKPPEEEEQPVEEEKEDLEKMIEPLPPEELPMVEDSNEIPEEPELSDEQDEVFGEFNLPDDLSQQVTEPIMEE